MADDSAPHLPPIMPHLFVNRQRQHGICGSTSATKIHFRWEVANAILYEIGGVLFVIGSLFFLPNQDANVGAWLFIAGSVLYITISLHDLIEVCQAPNNTGFLLDLSAGLLYTLGTICFIIGSVFFLDTFGLYKPGAYLFIIGSILFVAGAVVNTLQIFETPTTTSQTARLGNLTAVCYIVGSTIFLFGSVPYLYGFDAKSDETTIDRFLGIEFIIGSVCFVIGGFINALRVKAMSSSLLQTEDTGHDDAMGK